jgi:hypothetical protein
MSSCNEREENDMYSVAIFIRIIFLTIIGYCGFAAVDQVKRIKALNQRINAMELEIATQARIEAAIKEQSRE